LKAFNLKRGALAPRFHRHSHARRAQCELGTAAQLNCAHGGANAMKRRSQRTGVSVERFHIGNGYDERP